MIKQIISLVVIASSITIFGVAQADQQDNTNYHEMCIKNAERFFHNQHLQVCYRQRNNTKAYDACLKKYEDSSKDSLNKYKQMCDQFPQCSNPEDAFRKKSFNEHCNSIEDEKDRHICQDMADEICSNKPMRKF